MLHPKTVPRLLPGYCLFADAIGKAPMQGKDNHLGYKTICLQIRFVRRFAASNVWLLTKFRSIILTIIAI